MWRYSLTLHYLCTKHQMWSHCPVWFRHFQRFWWSRYLDRQYSTAIRDIVWFGNRPSDEEVLSQAWRVHWRTKEGFRRNRIYPSVNFPNFYWIHDWDHEDWRSNQMARMQAIHRFWIRQESRQNDTVFLWWVRDWKINRSYASCSNLQTPPQGSMSRIDCQVCKCCFTCCSYNESQSDLDRKSYANRLAGDKWRR